MSEKKKYNKSEYNRERAARIRQERKEAEVCTRCAGPRDGDTLQCKKCLEYQKRHTRNTAKKHYRDRIRLRVFEHYGNKCVCCGEHRMTMLHIDHINNDGAAHRAAITNGKRPRAGGTETYKWIIANDFPDTLQILCANCNDSKRRNGGVCEHITEKEAQVGVIPLD